MDERGEQNRQLERDDRKGRDRVDGPTADIERVVVIDVELHEQRSARPSNRSCQAYEGNGWAREAQNAIQPLDRKRREGVEVVVAGLSRLPRSCHQVFRAAETPQAGRTRYSAMLLLLFFVEELLRLEDRNHGNDPNRDQEGHQEQADRTEIGRPVPERSA